MPEQPCPAHSGIVEGMKGICHSVDLLREEILRDRADLKANDLRHIDDRLRSLEEKEAAGAGERRATNEALQRIEAQMERFASRPPEPSALKTEDGVTRKEFIQWIAVGLATLMSIISLLFSHLRGK